MHFACLSLFYTKMTLKIKSFDIFSLYFCEEILIFYTFLSVFALFLPSDKKDGAANSVLQG